MQAILSHRWKLSFIPTSTTPSSTPHENLNCSFLHVISAKSCALAEINSSQIIMHTCMRTHARTCIATYLRTYVHFMKQMLIEFCFNYLNPRRYVGFRYLLHHMRAANAQASLCIHAALLLSNTKQMDECR